MKKQQSVCAWKAADRNYPCKVVVFKNKLKCLATVTVLLLASIPPEGGHNYSNARGRKRGLGLLFPFEARSFCSQLHVYAKRTVEEKDILGPIETKNFSLLIYPIVSWDKSTQCILWQNCTCYLSHCKANAVQKVGQIWKNICSQI